MLLQILLQKVVHYKLIRRISTKNEEINSWTKTPEMPTSPKLMAFLVIILKSGYE